MTESEAIEELKNSIISYEVQNPSNITCDLTTEALDVAIQALEKQIPKKPYKDNENGIYEKEYCPICNRSLFPNDRHCICGQAIDWSDEE